MKTQLALNPDTVEGSELVQETFEFWFSDREHIRSPFPAYIQNDLKRISTERFFGWAKNLKEEAKDEMNEEMIGEKFEEIIFDAATQLVKTDDERITILYPFLPRCGDSIIDEHQISGTIKDRWIERDNDKARLNVKFETADKNERETSFELPL
ncbi:MAG: hypothetical protein IPM77_17540 [Crocinitomicaceae bacterium]|nr:hypothetical protein [Crocinitomicaceae bacterium]